MRSLRTFIALATLLAILAFAPGAPDAAPAQAADTLSREAQLAIAHVEPILPLILERWDVDLREALDEAARANLAEMNPQQADAVVMH